jgi:hypothetical protein
MPAIDKRAPGSLLMRRYQLQFCANAVIEVCKEFP